ncbi:MAG: nitrilase-related carbon-nitrogen hydrolase [Chitinophagaceae bacterium]
MANKQDHPSSQKLVFILFTIIFSGISWYFSNGLHGDYWWLLWIAPAPVLFVSFTNNTKRSFLISFTAYLIGRLSWFSYLMSVATLVPAIIFTLLLSLIFASIVLLTRMSVLKINSWLSVFAFPVFFTTFEFLLLKFSPDGTAASIAYSQSDFLPLIQIASVTGIMGITFIVCLIPSAIAVAYFYKKEKSKFNRITISTVIILMIVFTFGFIRLSNKTDNRHAVAGLVVLDEKYHSITQHPDFEKEKTVATLYAKEITALAMKGAKIVVLPERALNIGKESSNDIIRLLSNEAKENHVFIITGYTNFRNEKERNSALVIDSAGKVIADYNKVHLVTGLEAQFTPGNEAALFLFNDTQAGTAICKDMDFPTYIDNYGIGKSTILFIPAWDFVVDDWLHSRMAILRGVENGFSEVRAARQGRLTISDAYGKVTAETNCANGNKASLSGTVSLDRAPTLYLLLGNWLGIICITASLLFVLFSLKRRTFAAEEN